MKKLLFLLLALTGCATQTPVTEPAEKTAESAYLKAVNLMDEGELTMAVDTFDELERDYPYSPWTTKGQLMASYILYRKGKYPDAVLILDRFTSLHPGNKETPYAYFLKGMCQYQQISDTSRDDNPAKEAVQTFTQLVTRFPNSPYAEKAKQYIPVAVDQIIGKEMALGRFYLQQENPAPAVKHFQTVLTDYPESNYVPEALYRLTASYELMGLDNKPFIQQLKSKYADSVWYQKAEKIKQKEKK